MLRQSDPYALMHKDVKGYLNSDVYTSNSAMKPKLHQEQARRTITYSTSKENLDLNVTMNSNFPTNPNKTDGAFRNPKFGKRSNLRAATAHSK